MVALMLHSRLLLFRTCVTIVTSDSIYSIVKQRFRLVSYPPTPYSNTQSTDSDVAPLEVGGADVSAGTEGAADVNVDVPSASLSATGDAGEVAIGECLLHALVHEHWTLGCCGGGIDGGRAAVA